MTNPSDKYWMVTYYWGGFHYPKRFVLPPNGDLSILGETMWGEWTCTWEKEDPGEE